MMTSEKSRRGISRSASSAFLLLFLLLAIVSTLSLIFHVKGLSWENWRALFDGSNETLSYTVWDVRLPRVLLGIILGAGLAVGGCLLQAVTQNPLSDPEIMGVNQGASLFVASSLLFFNTDNMAAVILAAAFAGAFLGGSLIFALAFSGTYSASRLVLAGISVSFFLGSLTTGLIVLFETELTEILYWMAGKLSGAGWQDIRISGIIMGAAITSALFLSKSLNILSLGEDTARGLGISVTRTRRLSALLVVIITGCAVAAAGPIGFIGLIIPHIARKVVGADYKIVLPFSALAGAVLLTGADLAGQLLSYPSETPVGIITALLGAPFFLYLLRKKKGGA
ncbi:FecCD family ABC transporter permease [Fictibacillus iocasae]|uniref:FecCD family ABC transporter permease n=1 Tax=Fictibacillus iocasae TaxID=2715437 RepID=A0ABW2NXP5_9BACL